MIAANIICVEEHGEFRSFGGILEMIYESLLVRDGISRQAQPGVETVVYGDSISFTSIQSCSLHRQPMACYL